MDWSTDWLNYNAKPTETIKANKNNTKKLLSEIEYEKGNRITNRTKYVTKRPSPERDRLVAKVKGCRVNADIDSRNGVLELVNSMSRIVSVTEHEPTQAGSTAQLQA